MSYTSISTISSLVVTIKALRAVFASLLFIWSFWACQATTSDRQAYENIELKPLEGKWYFEGEPFTGVAYKKYTSDSLKEEISFVEGKKNGRLKRWFENGQLSYEANYTNNKLNGTSNAWYANGVKDSESHFVDGVVHGVQLQWYASGKPFKKMIIIDGKEEGIQQAWWENGKLYNNYEAKNGRTFGLKRSKLCHELQKEDIVK